MTNAQNLGRSAGYKKAIDLGIKGKIEWIATMDNRVRHSHAVLDGEKIEVGEKFSNGCRYPADPNGVGSEIYNCRCTTGFVLDGIEDDSNAYRIADNGMSYEEWKTFHSKMLNNSAMFRKKGEPFRGKVNIPSAVINKVTKKIRKKGAEIRTAEGEVLYRMNKEGASAATYGDIIFIRDDGVTISDILEETRHVEQNNSGLNDDKPAKLRILLNEIEAKEFILSCEKNYNIPREEIELTKEQLQSYRRQLDDYYRQNKSD